ncbi:hypothetical protein L3X38_033814 [Prunus dulcis]|uniref:Ubiquitin-like protease family profile domain-containing protein n=1 Tax=Prunus dulcis TaxID=3755 RepID=A0AAD4YX54_PRUDU|nr:hypothetical protein L3X38_033814 [Prunus dulcis]
MMKLCCLAMTLARAWRRQRFTLRDIDLDQPIAVLSQLNVWLNDEGKAVEQGVQLRKRKRIILMWKNIEASELVKNCARDNLTSDVRPNEVMQFGNVEAEIEFFASLVKAEGWLKGDVPACGMSWENAYKVCAPCMLTKYKHWVALMIDLVKCEIKVYDSMVSLISNEILKEELALLSITIPNLLNTIDFYEEGFYANDCSRDWWCPWPIERVDVPQQSNQ